MYQYKKSFFALVLNLLLTACGGGGSSSQLNQQVSSSQQNQQLYITGTVSGLGSGKQVILLNNAANSTTVSANGSISFSTPVAYNGSYAVTVLTQPTGQTCAVSNGSGAGVVANITNVTVTCSDTIPVTVSGPVAIKVTALSISPTDVLATTIYSPTIVGSISEFFKYTKNKLTGVIISNAYAVTGCGRLCSPAYPPVSFDTNQQVTRKIVSGTLSKIDVGFETVIPNTSVACDLSNAEIKVNKLFFTNKSNTDAIANLTIPTTVSSDCKLAYRTSDFFIKATGEMYELDKSVINSNIKDVIQAGDPSFNSSKNPLLVSSTNPAYYFSPCTVSELSINSNSGAVVLTELTSADAPVYCYGGAIAYDGNYLVGVATSFAGLIIYQKNNTAFKFFRNTDNSGYDSVFINNEGQFIRNHVFNMYVFDPVALTSTPWTPSKQAEAMYGHMGRYKTWIMSDRCIAWNYSNGDFINNALYPVYKDSGGWSSGAYNSNPSYARIESKFAYCVTQELRGFSKVDLDTKVGVGFDLDKEGYLAKSYDLFANSAFVTILNTSNSDMVYIELDFTTGKVIKRGVISQGNRKVVSLLPIRGG